MKKAKAKIVVKTSMGEFTLRQISEITGILPQIIRSRYYRGTRGDDLLLPIAHVGETKTEYQGQIRTLREISELSGISLTAIRERYRRGDRGEALGVPLKYTSANDRIGQRFGKLVVVGIERANSEKLAICKCDCGNYCKIILGNLVCNNSGNHSCGCENGKATLIHGLSTTREHRIWRGIFQRCYNPKTKYYHLYGGRGIVMCERWKESFVNFISDMGNAPGAGYSIDRIDSNGPYSPDNCHWATRLEQARNKRNVIYIEYNGHRRCISEWGEYFGCNPATIRSAYRAGWDMQKYFSRLQDMKDKYGYAKYRIDYGHHQGRK